MTSDLLEVVKDGVAVLTLNRPERLNAMSRPMLDALLEALPRLADDPAVGAVVLAGAGRGFCAGGDVKAMAEGQELGGDTLEEKAQALRGRMEVSRWLHELPKPTIAMVRGWCMGGGNEWQLYCDLCIASENAVFGQSGAKVGALPVVGATQYLPLLMGDRRAREMLFLAKRYTAQEAKAAGLINEVVPDGDLEKKTEEWCKTIISHAPATLRSMKTNLNYLGDLHYASWMHGSELLNAVWDNEQSDEGMQAFLEKRPPDFSRFPR